MKSTTTRIFLAPSVGTSGGPRLRSAGGKVEWKKSSGYHKRSLVETQMLRFKTILGGDLSSRLLANHVAAAKVKASS